MNPTKSHLRQARCAVDGHEWVVDHYTDALNKQTGGVILAAWISLCCQSCGEKQTIWNPEAEEPTP